ncbi:aldo/keto reductase [Trinickia caryophylli]|uniref:D-threo-aldose 1-dehydrogenase n=1 Tax=Trinickia caryophylli TaxID=28094 RepID=A0A1X7DDC2_TRICW|nr:aldo/keto reductase [Trinickia caryophylli]WQE12431.1 aldo/keto reductase [Trinickia caryophylli]GLU31420.1 aldo/keto reductase [Trinickia caryophylli]SMF13399.1 D-threo-aldose 1-dehydrogenase [Trinickia caryophylli]
MSTDSLQQFRRRVAIPGPAGFGAAPLGNLFSRVTDEAAQETLSAAWGAGIRYFDTAPFYGMGLSERRLGRALASYPRDAFVISTKVGRLLIADDSVPETQHGYVGGLPYRVEYDYTADGARRSIESSLERLGLDRIDIVYIHDVAEDTHGPLWRQHYRTAAGGAMKALSRLRDEGVIGGWGLGVNRVEPCLMALADADPDVFLIAGRYTLLDTTALDALIPACEARGARLVVGGPYNSGLLAGGDTFEYARADAAMLARRARLLSHCERFGVDLKAAALQFCKAPGVVACVIAGARNADEVRQNCAAMTAPVPREFWQALKEEGLVPQGAPVPA